MKIAIWEKEVMGRPESIEPKFLPKLELEKEGVTG